MPAKSIRTCGVGRILSNRAKRIAFVSYYGHNRRFFSFLAAHLPAGISVSHLNVYAMFASPEFLLRLGFAVFGLGAPPPTSAVRFARRKFRARHPGLSAPLTALVSWFQDAKARACYNWFRRHLADCDLVVLWNGALLPSATAAAAARGHGIATLFCENGYLPQTVVMDPCGVNALNALAGKPADFYRAVRPEADGLAALFAALPQPRALNARSGAKPPAPEDFALPEHYVFLPLQVHDDSQILLHSPRFSDMPAVVDFCARGVAAFNAAHGGNLKLVIKEHPSDYGRIDYAKLRARHPDLAFTRTSDTRELIAKAQAVITVNSTVGIEALLYLKPVVTLGDAFYNVPGLVYPCGGDEGLETALTEILNRPVDRDLVEKFLYHLRYDYLVAIDRRNLAEADPAPAVARLLAALR